MLRPGQTTNLQRYNRRNNLRHAGARVCARMFQPYSRFAARPMRLSRGRSPEGLLPKCPNSGGAMNHFKVQERIECQKSASEWVGCLDATSEAAKCSTHEVDGNKHRLRRWYSRCSAS